MERGRRTRRDATIEPITVGYEQFTTALAEAAGFDSFEGLWEAAFEQEAGQQIAEPVTSR